MLSWKEIIERETQSIGRPIEVIDKSEAKGKGIIVRTIIYLPEPYRVEQMGNRYRFDYRVSTWLSVAGIHRHVGSSSAKQEWRKSL